jgi:hypothetical protein
MEFRTIVDTPSFAKKIGYEHKILLVGSCFATSIAEQLQGLKFAAMGNPFGVLYNPLSVAKSLQAMAEKRLLTENDLHHEQGLWLSYTHHSRFAHSNKSEALRRINNSILKGAWGLKTADFLVVTLGTAWAYRLKKTGETVANCHKTPAQEFDRFLLSPSEISATLCEMVGSVQRRNPQLQIIFTVSPIRHWKDGAHGNQLSKSALLLAIEETLQQTQNTAYFPAYEIVLDELRDYRFYAPDMLHPSSVAVEYIWEKFVQAAVSDEAQKTMAEIKTLLAAKSHRPFNPDTAEHRAFLQAQEQKLRQLMQQYPHLDWNEEQQYFLVA